MSAEKVATVSESLDFDLSDVSMDVFDLADSGLTLESLTAGHGMPETGASCCTGLYSDSCGCSGCGAACSPAC